MASWPRQHFLGKKVHFWSKCPLSTRKVLEGRSGYLEPFQSFHLPICGKGWEAARRKKREKAGVFSPLKNFQGSIS